MNYINVKLRPEPARTQEVGLVSCIAQLREKAGITQRELANSVGVTESTIANWETGRRGLELFHRVICLCRTLSCCPEDLVKYAPSIDEGEDSTEAVSFSEILDLLGTHPPDHHSDELEKTDELDETESNQMKT